MKGIFKKLGLFLVPFLLTGCGFVETLLSNKEGSSDASSGVSSKWYYDDNEHFHYDESHHKVDVAPHDLVETNRVEPSCDSDGSIEYQCSVCDYVKYVTLPAEGHQPGNTYYHDATHHWKTCSVCGDIIGREAHDFEELSRIEPTFEEPGSASYKCRVCEYEHSATLPVKEHTYSDYQYNDTHHWKRCLDEGYTDRIKDYGEHRYSETTVAPTKETEGYTLHKCICGKSYTDNYVSRLWNKRELDYYKDHYLVDLFSPIESNNVEILKSTDIKTLEDRNTARKMGGEDYSKGFRFAPSSTSDAYVTYALEGDYRSLCFGIGFSDAMLGVYDSYYHTDLSMQIYLNGSSTPLDFTHNGMDPVKWYSVDINGVSTIKFFFSSSYTNRNELMAMEVSLWGDSNHQIDESKPLAVSEENIDEVCGETIRKNPSNASYRIVDIDKTVKVNNHVCEDGLVFSPSANYLFNSEKPFYAGQRHTYNTFGRYHYIHFNLGHVDTAINSGGILLNVYAGSTLLKQIHFLQSDLPIEVTVNINFAHYITFQACADPEEGGEGTSMGSVSTYAVYNIVGSPFAEREGTPEKPIYNGSYKVLSQIGRPYNFINAYDVIESVFNGSSSTTGIQIGGIIYTEGLLMKSVFNIMTTTEEQIPASADFDLDGQFKYVTFKVGRRDRSAIVCETLNVYLDGAKVKTLALDSIANIQSVQVEVTGAKKLTIELEGSSNTYRGSYGVVDLAFHTDTVRELDFVHTPQSYSAKDYYSPNTTVELMDQIQPYDSFSLANKQSIMTDYRVNTAEYTGGTEQFVTNDGENHNRGFVLQTGTYTGFGFGDDAISIGVMLCGEPVLVAAAAQSVNCSSFVAFAMRGKFVNLSFDICSLANFATGQAKTLKIYGDMNLLKTTNLTSGSVAHIDVNISGVENLVFFLEYGEGSTIPFGCYNLFASN